jgi:hypothetical protein
MSYHCNFQHDRVLDKGSEMGRALAVTTILVLVAFGGLSRERRDWQNQIAVKSRHERLSSAIRMRVAWKGMSGA